LPDTPQDPRGAATFVFTACGYDPAPGSPTGLSDKGPELVERITFPHAPWPSEASRQAAFGRALELLHGIAGVSYYKAGLSPAMRFNNPAVGSALGAFLTQVYIQGLGEFGHVNGLDVAARVRFLSLGRAPRRRSLRRHCRCPDGRWSPWAAARTAWWAWTCCDGPVSTCCRPASAAPR
jgi:hypothetical protein